MKNIPIKMLVFFAASLLIILLPAHNSKGQIITTFAGGTGGVGFNGDGIVATTAQLSAPTGTFVDKFGNVYIADASGNRLRKINRSGIISTLAGDGTAAISGDGGPASSAQLMFPHSVVVDRIGNIYIASVNAYDAICRIRKIDTAGVITNFAGNDTLGYSGDEGPATDARISAEYLAIDSHDNIYFTQRDIIRKIDTSGIIHTIAGEAGTLAYDGDGGPATAAHFYWAGALSVNSSGTIAVIDYHGVRKIDTSGTITTVAGSVLYYGFSGDGGPATSALFSGPGSIAIDNIGNIFVTDGGNNRIRKIDTSGIVTTIGGTNYYVRGSYNGDGIAATAALLQNPCGISLDTMGNIYFADWKNSRVRKIATSGIISTLAGTATPGYSGDGAAAMSAQFFEPRGLSFDNRGNLFVADHNTARIRKITPGGIITTAVGDGIFGYTGDGAAATSAHIGSSYCVKADGRGNLYFGEYYAYIRKVDSSGVLSTIAGTGVSGYSGDGGQATAAKVSDATDIVIDAGGNIYFSDWGNFVIRKIAPSGIITTVAGTGGVSGFSGDGGPATAAKLNYVNACALDRNGNLYIADYANQRIRKVDTAGIISTIAGTGTAGYSGDGGPATAAQIDPAIYGLACDSVGNLFFCEFSNSRIRKIDTSNIISTIAGTGIQGNTGNGGLSTLAKTTRPRNLTFDRAGNLFFSDGNYLIRKIELCTLPDAGIVAGLDSVCVGNAIVLTDTVPGGIWISSNNSLATISSIGILTGVSAGIVNIYYVVNNLCGADTSVFPVTVKVVSSCSAEVGNCYSEGNSLNIFPNPNSGSFSINISSALYETVQVVVTDIIGKKIKEFFAPTNKSTDVSLESGAGVYFVSISAVGRQINTQKLVILQE